MSTPADSCSAVARLTEEPIAGTAPQARAWLVLEHPGPWGKDAIEDSSLPDDLNGVLSSALQDHGVRTILARSDARRRLEESTSRHIWVAVPDNSGGSGRFGVVRDLRSIVEWDFAGIGRGILPRLEATMTSPREFVCTHGKRDLCCATEGRAHLLARKALGSEPWECSHLGGHRFAATSLFLPSGRVYGRLGPDAPFSRDGEPAASQLRGASFLSPPEQVADTAVRVRLDLPWSVPTVVTTLVEPAHEATDPVIVTVETPVAGNYRVTCIANSVATAASCGGEPKPRTVWAVHEMATIA